MVAKGTITSCTFYKDTEEVTKVPEGTTVRAIAGIKNDGDSGKVCLRIDLYKKSGDSFWKTVVAETQIYLNSGASISKYGSFTMPDFDIVAKAYGGHVE